MANFSCQVTPKTVEGEYERQTPLTELTLVKPTATTEKEDTRKVCQKVTRRLKPMLMRKLTEWSMSTTSHGIPRIVQAKLIYLRVMWTIFLMISVGMCSYMITKSVLKYMEFDVTTKIRMVATDEMTFPVITICNVNAFVTNEASEYLRSNLDYKRNFNITMYFDSYKNITYDDVDNQSEWLMYITNHPYFNLTIIKSFGYKAKEMFKNCMYRNDMCGPNDFEWYYNPYYGNCFKFNTGRDINGNKQDLKVVRREGEGFSIEIFSGVPDTYNSYLYETYTKGLVVMINDQVNF